LFFTVQLQKQPQQSQAMGILITVVRLVVVIAMIDGI